MSLGIDHKRLHACREHISARNSTDQSSNNDNAAPPNNMNRSSVYSSVQSALEKNTKTSEFSFDKKIDTKPDTHSDKSTSNPSELGTKEIVALLLKVLDTMKMLLDSTHNHQEVNDRGANSGNSNSGNSNSGNSNSGNSNYGNSNSGNSNYGNSNYGNSNYGNSNYGNSNYGNSNSGNSNSGNSNYGNSNYGNSNSGNSNSGNSNSGSYNGGTPNSGVHNGADNHNGTPDYKPTPSSVDSPPATPAETTTNADSANKYFGYGVKADKFISNENGYRDKVLIDLKDSGNTGILTTENLMKPENMANAQKREQAKDFIRIAKENGVDDIRGHALNWHRQGDPEMEKLGTGDRKAGLNQLDNYIGGMMKDFGKDVTTWDVVNEAYNEDGTKRQNHSDNGNVNQSLRVIGDDAVEQSFKSARAHSPDAKLMYNDFNLEANDKKFNAVLGDLSKMNADSKATGGNSLVDGIGFQGHFKASEINDPNYMQKFSEHIQKAKDSGFEVHLTEIDIRGDSNITDEAKKLGQFLKEQGVNTVQWWNIDDSKSWISGEFGGGHSPTLSDNNSQRKPAYTEFMKGFNT